MSAQKNAPPKKPAPGETMTDETTEANKPKNARAKGNPKAGNILAGVQSD